MSHFFAHNVLKNVKLRTEFHWNLCSFLHEINSRRCYSLADHIIRIVFRNIMLCKNLLLPILTKSGSNFFFKQHLIFLVLSSEGSKNDYWFDILLSGWCSSSYVCDGECKSTGTQVKQKKALPADADKYRGGWWQWSCIYLILYDL